MKKKTIDQIIEIEPKLKVVFDRILSKRKTDKSNWDLYLSCKKSVVRIFSEKDSLLNLTDYKTIRQILAISLYL